MRNWGVSFTPNRRSFMEIMVSAIGLLLAMLKFGLVVINIYGRGRSNCGMMNDVFPLPRPSGPQNLRHGRLSQSERRTYSGARSVGRPAKGFKPPQKKSLFLPYMHSSPPIAFVNEVFKEGMKNQATETSIREPIKIDHKEQPF